MLTPADTASLLRDPELGGPMRPQEAKPEEQPPTSSLCSCFSVKYYQPYFDVDTEHIRDRVLYAVIPFKQAKTFLELLGTNADAYGPFWTATTLIFVIAVISNFTSWVHFNGQHWTYDFQRVVSCAATIYGFAAGVPVLIWLVLRYIKLPLPLIQVLAIYGYSLIVFIPLTLLNFIPSRVVWWLSELVASGWSLAFLLKAFGPNLLEKAPKYAVPFLGGLAAVQLALALTIKLAFFKD